MYSYKRAQYLPQCRVGQRVIMALLYEF